MRTFFFLVLLSGAAAALPAVRAQSASVDGRHGPTLWEAPAAPSERDLFNGPWGAALAPDPHDTYTFVHRKADGVNPGLVVRDSRGRTWHVKQAPGGERGDEGPVEVAISRVLSAIGYHQPPVYYLPSFVMADGSRRHAERGGRFRLSDDSIRARGTWSWKDNPFVGTRPYNGLLVVLLVFNSWDLKDSNNRIYEIRRGDRIETWYVARDLGGALGDSGTMSPKRNNLVKFERSQFIEGVSSKGFVEFDYKGKRADLLEKRVTLDDLRWASRLLAELDARQWRDAFRAGGYPDLVSERFIEKIHANIAHGLQMTNPAWRSAADGR
jgi:hypothetical protein